MKTLTRKTVAVLLAASSFLGLSAKTTITSWDFGTTATTTDPAVGTGTFSLIGGTSYDPDKTGIDSGVATESGILGATESGLGYAVINFPTQGTSEKTAGIQVNVSTVGYQNIKFTADVRHGNKCANTTVLQYTVNGTDWVDATTYVASVTDDTWFLRSFDFTSIADVNNNANFAVRFVSAFQSGTSTYMPSNTTSVYATNKGYRFDNLEIQGDAITSVVNDAKTSTWKLVGTTLSFGETTSADIEVYSLSGLKVATYAPTSSVELNLTSGMYIVKVADSVKKVIVK